MNISQRTKPPVLKWLSGVWFLFALCLLIDGFGIELIRGEWDGLTLSIYSGIALVSSFLGWGYLKRSKFAWFLGITMSALFFFWMILGVTSYSGGRLIDSWLHPQSAPRYISQHHNWRLPLLVHFTWMFVSTVLMVMAFFLAFSKQTLIAYGSDTRRNS